MAQKHLHELLKEDQEPFFLKNYIADRRCQLKRPSPKTHLQVKKRKPISETPSFPGNFCKNACFFSFQDSPDLRKSPLFDFSSPAKSPCRSPNAIFLQIPARTATLLLEAAMQMVGERFLLLEPAGRWHLLDKEQWENDGRTSSAGLRG